MMGTEGERLRIYQRASRVHESLEEFVFKTHSFSHRQEEIEKIPVW